jgi:hypothetical protein
MNLLHTRELAGHYRINSASGAQGRRVAGGGYGGTPLAQLQKELGMQEGFDVGLEMSGKESALREMIANMARFWLSTSSGGLFRPVVILESEA